MKYKFSNECEEGSISVTEEAWCECCLELEPFEPTFCCGGTWWCDGCWDANGNEVPDGIMAKAMAKSKEAQLKFYRAKAKELEASS